MESPLNPPKGEVRLGDIAFSLLLGSRRRPKEDKTWKDFLPYLRKMFFRRERKTPHGWGNLNPWMNLP